jgi:hypothetical protein
MALELRCSLADSFSEPGTDLGGNLRVERLTQGVLRPSDTSLGRRQLASIRKRQPHLLFLAPHPSFNQADPARRPLMPLTGAEPLVVEAPLILWFGLS